jgi:uncharacterized membrane protein YdjX (TVP38/TMEM64 family)
VFLLITLAVVWIGYTFPLLPLIESYIDPKALGEWVNEHGFFGISAFAILSAIAAAIGLPRQLIALIAGYSFGLLDLLHVLGSCGAFLKLLIRLITLSLNSHFLKF